MSGAKAAPAAPMPTKSMGPPKVLVTSGDRPDPEINKLFRAQIKFEGSDLHLQTNKPPILRIRGTLRELQMPPITEEQMYNMFSVSYTHLTLPTIYSV